MTSRHLSRPVDGDAHALAITRQQSLRQLPAGSRAIAAPAAIAASTPLRRRDSRDMPSLHLYRLALSPMVDLSTRQLVRTDTIFRKGTTMRPLRLVILFAATMTALMVALPCSAQTTFGGPTGPTRLSRNQYRGSGRVASLSDQLKSGLKARRDVEFQFIDNVVKLVETRKLPVKLVVETFQYARLKPTRYPFQYFQRALALRAARIGVTIKTV